MADFVAVIRRAVDGLSDNTPELRAKVYDKARSAVLRQLESMKPRPPEEMLRRQLDKLEAAILAVESEHAEALLPPDAPDGLAADMAAEPATAVQALQDEPPILPAGPAAHEPVAETAVAETRATEPAQTVRDDWEQVSAPQAPVLPVPAASPPAGGYLYGDESWAGEEEDATPEEAQAPAAPLEPAPAASPAPAPAEPAPAVYHEDEVSSLPPEPATAPQTVQMPDVADAWHDPRDLVSAADQDEVWREEQVAEPYSDREEAADIYPPEVPEPSAIEPAWTQEPDEPPRQPADETAGAAYHDRYEHEQDIVPPEPVAAFAPEPSPHASEPVYDPADEAYPDFPVADPVQQYSHPFDETPASEALTTADPQDWPENGVEAPASAHLEEEEWTASARLAPADDLDPQMGAQADLLHPGQVAPLMPPDDPFAWSPETSLVHTAALAELQAVQGDFTAPAQDADTRSMPVAGQAVQEAAGFGAEPVYHEQLQGWEAEAAPAPMASEPAETEARIEAGQPAYVPAPAPEFQPAGQPENLADSQDGWDVSPFDDVPLPEAGREPQAGNGSEPAGQEWEQFGDFDAYEGVAKRPDDAVAEDEFLFTPVERPTRSYRIEPKRRVDFTSIGLGLLGLLLVAGSGYGAWVFRDTLSGLVTGLVSTPPSQESKVVPASKTAADGKGQDTVTPAKPATTTTPQPATPATTEALDAEPEVQKFTQRLNTDGSEIDEGRAEGGVTGEGTSVAPQTVASNEPVDTPAPATTPAASANASPAVIPAGASQKMFLYEERLGQTSPVAIEGSAVWSLKREPSDNGKDEAVVQAQITAPARGLSALITFKRNLDPSLPASHLVELVFSLPKDFDGGAIESVQRVAMKETEQDRGDPLIAVPAKITDDFHMIALNDYADARSFNLRLMQTRNWIDIPLTYRNGRRALLTMEKGAAGTEAFNQAIREWQAAEGPAPAPAPAQAQTPAAPQDAAPPATPQ